MPSPKKIQDIMKEYSEIMDLQDATGLRYNKDWLRSSMQSLLLHVMGEGERKKWMFPKGVGMKQYNRGIDSCLAVIQSTIDSIKE